MELTQKATLDAVFKLCATKTLAAGTPLREHTTPSSMMAGVDRLNAPVPRTIPRFLALEF